MLFNGLHHCCSYLRGFVPVGLTIACGLFSNDNFAERDVDNNSSDGLNVSVSLNHQVTIPQILFFRIGSTSAVDQVEFDLAQSQVSQPNNSNYDGSPIVPGSGTTFDATNNGSLDVYLVSNVAPVDISYTVSNGSGLVDGAGNFIPFSQIETQSSDAGLPAPTLDNAGAAVGSANAVTVSGNSFGGRVANYNAMWTYRYSNDLHPVAGVYTGRVTYTASSP